MQMLGNIRSKKRMISKYNGRCSFCKKKIIKGVTEIIYDFDQKKAFCVGCPTQPGAQTPTHTVVVIYCSGGSNEFRVYEHDVERNVQKFGRDTDVKYVKAFPCLDVDGIHDFKIEHFFIPEGFYLIQNKNQTYRAIRLLNIRGLHYKIQVLSSYVAVGKATPDDFESVGYLSNRGNVSFSSMRMDQQDIEFVIKDLIRERNFMLAGTAWNRATGKCWVCAKEVETCFNNEAHRYLGLHLPCYERLFPLSLSHGIIAPTETKEKKSGKQAFYW